MFGSSSGVPYLAPSHRDIAVEHERNMGSAVADQPFLEGERWRGQGPDTPLAPSTKFTVRLCRRPATAPTWYSPGRTNGPLPLQPDDEVLRSQETRRAAGFPLAITTRLEPAPLAQSAELQMRRSPAEMTTDTNFGLMLRRHGRLSRETACTVKMGVLPG